MELSLLSSGPCVEYNMETRTYSYNGRCIQLAQVQGLATPGAAPRKGRLTVQTRSWYRGKHQYKISADHQYPIPDGEYSLLCAPGQHFRLNGTACVVGKILPDQTFLKTSVFKIIDWRWKLVRQVGRVWALKSCVLFFVENTQTKVNYSFCMLFGKVPLLAP